MQKLRWVARTPTDRPRHAGCLQSCRDLESESPTGDFVAVSDCKDIYNQARTYLSNIIALCSMLHNGIRYASNSKEHSVKKKPKRAISARFHRKAQSVIILLIASAAAFLAVVAVEFCMIGVTGMTGILMVS